MQFLYGTTIQVLPRTGAVFGAAVDVAGCAVAPRDQSEPLADEWPPLIAGKTVFAPYGSPIERGDRLVIGGITYDVDGEPGDWMNPFTGARPGMVVQTTRADGWFDTPVSFQGYLGSGGFGPVYAAGVATVAYIDSTPRLVRDSDGTEVTAEATLRFPPLIGGVATETLIVPESIVTVNSVDSTVITSKPFYKYGAVMYVEVTTR